MQDFMLVAAGQSSSPYSLGVGVPFCSLLVRTKLVRAEDEVLNERIYNLRDR